MNRKTIELRGQQNNKGPFFFQKGIIKTIPQRKLSVSSKF